MTEISARDTGKAPAGKAQSKFDYALTRFGRCLLGYLAGCIGSAVWVSLVTLVQSAGAETIDPFWRTFVFAGLLTAAFAVPAAPLLILLGEVLRLRALVFYILLAVLAAVVSANIWLVTEDLTSLDAIIYIVGAGVFSGLAFWLVSVRGRRQIKAQPAAAL